MYRRTLVTAVIADALVIHGTGGYFDIKMSSQQQKNYKYKYKTSKALLITICLTHCGLATPYEDIDLGQHLLR